MYLFNIKLTPKVQIVVCFALRMAIFEKKTINSYFTVKKVEPFLYQVDIYMLVTSWNAGALWFVLNAKFSTC